MWINTPLRHFSFYFIQENYAHAHRFYLTYNISALGYRCDTPPAPPVHIRFCVCGALDSTAMHTSNNKKLKEKYTYFHRF